MSNLWNVNSLFYYFPGFDSQEVLVKLLSEARDSNGPVGMDCSSGEVINPADLGIYDNYNVKRQMIHSCTVIACNLLLVDEIMKSFNRKIFNSLQILQIKFHRMLRQYKFRLNNKNFLNIMDFECNYNLHIRSYHSYLI